ncbi:hypothetical protein CALVIDRAFT_537005 [Calocera viscosa TUFC12733]|uniref:Uncharacterized protein n=1 Tax=Calocera viscosa (strain TUFC12733) TaxID=1330018 RepID=A0A167MER0_CALVF|nr:hypothetical protein CALVIDRAFT_537005 [Calocera viscosa TUFC12733]
MLAGRRLTHTAGSGIWASWLSKSGLAAWLSFYPVFYLHPRVCVLSKMVANPTYEAVSPQTTPFKSFRDFYPFYLGEHRNKVNRALHLVGTTGSIALGVRLAASAVPYICGLLSYPQLVNRTRGWVINEKDVWKWALLAVVNGYAFAWVGHFFVEKNRPATFKYPLYSLRGDFTMLWEVLTFQRKAW